VTFDRIVEHCTGRPAPVRTSNSQGRKRPPRLSEAWFCCAEPTESQMGRLLRPEIAF
jgi:hypothetical protein